MIGLRVRVRVSVSGLGAERILELLPPSQCSYKIKIVYISQHRSILIFHPHIWFGRGFGRRIKMKKEVIPYL